MGVAGILQVITNALLLVVGQRIHRVHQQGCQARLGKTHRIFDGVLDHRKQEGLRFAGSGAGGDCQWPGVGPQQMADRFALMEIGGLRAAALLHHLCQARVETELSPGEATLERSVGLEEGLLCQEASFIEGCLQCLAQLGVAGLELRGEVAAVLPQDLLDDGDGVEGHASNPPAGLADNATSTILSRTTVTSGSIASAGTRSASRW